MEPSVIRPEATIPISSGVKSFLIFNLPFLLPARIGFKRIDRNLEKCISRVGERSVQPCVLWMATDCCEFINCRSEAAVPPSNRPSTEQECDALVWSVIPSLAESSESSLLMYSDMSFISEIRYGAVCYISYLGFKRRGICRFKGEPGSEPIIRTQAQKLISRITLLNSENIKP